MLKKQLTTQTMADTGTFFATAKAYVGALCHLQMARKDVEDIAT
jgi:hypothetical protein